MRPLLDAADLPEDALGVADLIVDLLLLRREEHRRVDVRRLRQQQLLLALERRKLLIDVRVDKVRDVHPL